MSNLAIAAAHLAGLPPRYAVGRWSNLSLNTILIFNAVDIGLITLMRTVAHYVLTKYEIKDTFGQRALLSFSTRTVACIAAYYAASWMNHPIPARDAALTTAAAFAILLTGRVIISELFYKNSDQEKQAK